MCLCFFIRDVTMRRKAEEMLRKEHTAIHFAGSGIVIADPEVKLEYANPAFAGMLGLEDPDELLGLHLRELLAEPSAADELIANAKRDQQPWIHEMTLLRQDGEEVYVQVSAAGARGPDGELVAIVFSFADITERKLAEEATEAAHAELERQGGRKVQELLERVEQLQLENAELRAGTEGQERSAS